MTDPTQADRTWPLIAAAASVVFPGLGQTVAGRGGRGALWLLANAALLVAGLALFVMWPPAPLLGLATSVAAYVLCVVDAYRCGSRRRPVRAAWAALYAVSAIALFVVLPIAGAVALRAFVVEAFSIPSAGMCPTLEVGDHIFVDHRAYVSEPPQRGDVVVHRDPGPPAYDFVRRVMAVGGDRVEWGAEGFRVNGTPVPVRCDAGSIVCDDAERCEEELGTVHAIARRPRAQQAAVGAVTVPRGDLFLVGDNRDNSYDSRSTGTAPARLVTGRVWRRWARGGRLVWEEIR
jgi:signal peptidase I